MKQRGQAMVEFGMTMVALMILVVGTAQVAIFLNYRTNLDMATREGAFQASLVGHQPADGQTAAAELWARLEPGAAPATITVTQDGNLIIVSADAYAPALVPVPMPPFTRMAVHARSVHTLERFEPGSTA